MTDYKNKLQKILLDN